MFVHGREDVVDEGFEDWVVGASEDESVDEIGMFVCIIEELFHILLNDELGDL